MKDRDHFSYNSFYCFQGRSNYVTPRHYLDFINHFVTLMSEKREELEEQQLHLNVGLAKLKETQEQVTELQKSLRDKSQILELKQTEANAKLQQMVHDQQSKHFIVVPLHAICCAKELFLFSQLPSRREP